MSLRQDTEDAPDVEVASFRFLSSQDGKSGKLSVVVGGVHHLFPCTLIRALHGAESIMESARKRIEDGH